MLPSEKGLVWVIDYDWNWPHNISNIFCWLCLSRSFQDIQIVLNMLGPRSKPCVIHKFSLDRKSRTLDKYAKIIHIIHLIQIFLGSLKIVPPTLVSKIFISPCFCSDQKYSKNHLSCNALQFLLSDIRKCRGRTNCFKKGRKFAEWI